MAFIPVVILSDGRTGPESDLTPELAMAIATFVAQGASPLRAAGRCKVPRTTWYGWVSKHKRGMEPYKTLLDSIFIVRDADSAELEMEVRSTVDPAIKMRMLKERAVEEVRQEPPKMRDIRSLTDAELEEIAYGAIKEAK